MMTGQGILGLAAFTGLAWAFSENRARFPWRVVLGGLALQAVIALVLLNWPPAQALFFAANQVVLALQSATHAGTSLVFGYLGGGALPFKETHAGSSFVLAFQALPLVLVISALSALLFHWRVLPVIVRGFAWALKRTLGIGGAAGVATAANVFVGMVEAPLLVRPYVARLTRSELFVVMTVGMATLAGTMLTLYATFLQGIIPDPAGHLLTASLMNAPAAVVVARLMVPEADAVADDETVEGLSPDTSSMEAITRGTAEGVQLLINIIAMLVVLVALISLANTVLGLLPDVAGGGLTLQRLLGWVMAPVVWLMGVPWSEALPAGQLMGIKVILNELLAYLEMSRSAEGLLGDRTRMILAYAMASFANFGSLGIMIGGLTTMAPERRGEIVQLGPRTIVSGTLATCLTGAMVGLLG